MAEDTGSVFERKSLALNALGRVDVAIGELLRVRVAAERMEQGDIAAEMTMAHHVLEQTRSNLLLMIRSKP